MLLATFPMSVFAEDQDGAAEPSGAPAAVTQADDDAVTAPAAATDPENAPADEVGNVAEPAPAAATDPENAADGFGNDAEEPVLLAA